jgi:hypothetical protein
MSDQRCVPAMVVVVKHSCQRPRDAVEEGHERAGFTQDSPGPQSHRLPGSCLHLDMSRVEMFSDRRSPCCSLSSSVPQHVDSLDATAPSSSSSRILQPHEASMRSMPEFFDIHRSECKRLVSTPWLASSSPPCPMMSTRVPSRLSTVRLAEGGSGAAGVGPSPR